MKKAGIQALAVLTMNIEPAVAQIKGLTSGLFTMPETSRTQNGSTEGAFSRLTLNFASRAQASSNPGGPAARKPKRHPQRSAINPPRRKARKVPTGLPAMVMAIAEV